MRTNRSPISELHYFKVEAVALNQSKKPLLTAGDTFRRMLAIEREARTQRIAKIEDR